ncbi:MAG: carboxypeptidase regulatory-like domain-containing protein [Armatimonadetes bacterium]|nr:carboxypeptidase regulatory-like domain-containing protein [Armatimonadota bacterium]
MIRGRWTSIIVGTALITLAAGIVGCGSGAGFPGGGGPPPPPPPPAQGTASIQGVVVDSQNTATRIAGAEVRLAADGQADRACVLTDGNGSFRLDKLQAGGVNVEVTFPSTPTYQAMIVPVDTVKDKTTVVTIAALRSGVTPPTSVTLSPSDAQVDVGGEVQFDADVRIYGVPANIVPSFSLLGDIGTLLPSGLFTATKVGTGEVTAFFPQASVSANVEVIGPRVPQLGTLAVSPTNLPADGGPVRIAISATDGNGIARVEAKIVTLNKAPGTLVLLLDSGNDRDGSWAGTFTAPANSNPIGWDGVQLDQRYSVQVKVTDRSGTSTKSGWVDFVVAGLEAPPGPP